MSLLACVFALHSHSLSLFSSTITAAEVCAKRAYILKTTFACEDEGSWNVMLDIFSDFAFHVALGTHRRR